MVPGMIVYALGLLTLSTASAGSLTVVNPNFATVAVQCSVGFAYEASPGSSICPSSPSSWAQELNTALGVGWTFAAPSSWGDGLTNPNTVFEPPPFDGLPFSVAAFLQGNTAIFGQTISGFVPGGTYTLNFYLGSRYTYAGYSGNQTVKATIDGQVIGTWALTSLRSRSANDDNF